MFEANTSIEVLNLADTRIDGASCARLCTVLKEKNASLAKIYFRNCRLGSKGAAAIAELIRDNTSLTELEIFNCEIDG